MPRWSLSVPLIPPPPTRPTGALHTRGPCHRVGICVFGGGGGGGGGCGRIIPRSPKIFEASKMTGSRSKLLPSHPLASASIGRTPRWSGHSLVPHPLAFNPHPNPSPGPNPPPASAVPRGYRDGVWRRGKNAPWPPGRCAPLPSISPLGGRHPGGPPEPVPFPVPRFPIDMSAVESTVGNAPFRCASPDPVGWGGATRPLFHSKDEMGWENNHPPRSSSLSPRSRVPRGGWPPPPLPPRAPRPPCGAV